MGRTKAKKKIPPMPKLGFVDQMIYLVGFLLIFAVFCFLLWFQYDFVEDRLMTEPGAVAVYRNDTEFLFMPFCLTFLLSLFIPWYSLHSKRYPFFGKWGVKYGPPAYPRTFPLFMKNKPQYWKSPSEARMRRATAVFVVVLNLVFLSLVPLSIHGRDMLYADGTVRDYNVFDRMMHEYSPEDAGEVTLSIGRHKTGKYAYSWRLTVYIDYGDRAYRFYHGSFDSPD